MFCLGKGINLGRYWGKRPTLSLWMPDKLLRKGMNEVIVLELQEADIMHIDKLVFSTNPIF